MRWLGVLIGALIGAGLVLAGRDMLAPERQLAACEPCATDSAAMPPDSPPARALPRDSSGEALAAAPEGGYAPVGARRTQDGFGADLLAEERGAEEDNQAQAPRPPVSNSRAAPAIAGEPAAGIPQAEGPLSPRLLGSGPAPEQSSSRLPDASSEVGSAAVGGGRSAAVTALDGASWQAAADADAGMALSGPLQPETDVPANSPALSWHSFWQPFTSELSARGFASRLESLTGLDYQVRRTGPGRYEVVFAHLDDVQRDAHLARIQAVTGLDLGGDR